MHGITNLLMEVQKKALIDERDIDKIIEKNKSYSFFCVTGSMTVYKIACNLILRNAPS